MILSWYWEKDKKHGREALRFSNIHDAKKYAEENLINDVSVLDYDFYVSILELNGIKAENNELKNRIASAISILEGKNF